MCIATKQVCEVCDKSYYQRDMRIDHFLKCDECRGIKPQEPKVEKPFNMQDWIELITTLYH